MKKVDSTTRYVSAWAMAISTAARSLDCSAPQASPKTPNMYLRRKRLNWVQTCC
ncbi:MAG: hypothetical protein ACI9US_000937 [Gammaproteobacteria bacterium]|jgi:hypothetical protein